ncbi:hypothetical protein NP233_g11667 [Leucocoprinus birnbaumii]|uniref:Cytochrome P450 n=1 Tax=Leucocoprinus birnbaumii TaxID=56174 RepID=A0AAD5YQQ6_9AGAR|nr:hypothetical protein NP233_g11667 [Leucocoprinus birnbaumii]
MAAIAVLWRHQLPSTYRYAELEDYWSRSRNTRSIATAIYLIMKSLGILYFIAVLYGRLKIVSTKASGSYSSPFLGYTYPHVTRAMRGVCMDQWFVSVVSESLHTLSEATLSIVDIGYIAAIKVILILRLRAIYGYDRKVSILLYALIAIEMAPHSPVQISFSLPGCWFQPSTLSWSLLVVEHTTRALWITRVAATSVALNTERRFSHRSLWSAIGERRHLTPVLYIFHRDGALLIIPILAVSTLGLVGWVLPSSAAGGVDWNMWLILTYQLCIAVIKESLRLSHGATYPLARVADDDTLVAGRSIPAGTILAIGATFVHLNPEIFVRSVEPQPDRWLDGHSIELDSYLVAFSKGPRKCLGMNERDFDFKAFLTPKFPGFLQVTLKPASRDEDQICRPVDPMGSH